MDLTHRQSPVHGVVLKIHYDIFVESIITTEQLAQMLGRNVIFARHRN
jgi:hypothetical protein